MNAEHQQPLMLGTSEGSDRMNETEQTLASVGYASTRASIGSGRSDIVDTPQDWSVKTISEVAVVRTGPFGSALHERDYVDDGTPIITVEHLSERGIVHEGLPLVSDADRSRLAEYELRAGDIVFSRVGSIDRNSLISKEESGWLFSGRLLRVRTLDDAIYPPYLSYHFHSEPFKRRVRTVAVGQTMASLNTNILNAVCVVLPSTPEQHAIAEALSDVDDLLGALEAVIAKKQDIKRAAMQQLLTGKTRLPGFTEEWKRVQVGDVAAAQQGGTPPKSRTEYWDGDIPFVTGADLSEFSVSRDNARSFLTVEGLNSGATVICEPGALLLATRTRVGLVSMASEIMGASQDITLLKPKDLVEPPYLCRALMSQSDLLLRSARGTTIQGISRGEVDSIPILLPPRPEQHAIATALSDMDAEIAALEERRDKIDAIKQGMMQVLLTGRVRLVKPDVVAEASSC